MKINRVIALSAIIFPCLLIAAEPSAFGAGDLNNPNPYGLTSTEATILETKKNLNKIVVKSNNQANEVDSLRERVDGLQTIIESISSSARENKLKIKSLDEKNLLDQKNSSEYDKRVNETIEQNSKYILVNTQNIEKINLQIMEISKIIDSINRAYVSKDEFNTLVNDVNNFKDLVVKEMQKSQKPLYDNMKTGDIETQARALYDKKDYDESIKLYKHLIDKNYKPARSHYMIGEMYYYKANYADAIAYFKKSASLYSKADYMPILMLHTAVSMDKTGDKKNAKVFYNAIIKQYPESSYAETAKSKLSSIK